MEKEEITIELKHENKTPKRHAIIENIIYFYCIIMVIPIMLIDGLISLFKKTSKSKDKKTDFPRVKDKELSFQDKKRLLLNTRTSLVYITISVFIIFGSIYAFFSDKIIAEQNMQAGTVLVKIDEVAPFDDLGSIPEGGANTNEKSFRAISICTLDTYVRARIIPVIEKYDEEEDCYVVIPIDIINDVKLNVSAPDWTYSNGYYYYNDILEPEAMSEYIDITVSIKDAGDYENTNVRVTLRVELEAAQVRNDLWKQIFNIEGLPF